PVSALSQVPTGAPEYRAAQALLPLAALIAEASNGSGEGLDALYREAGRLVLQRRVPDAVSTLLDILRKNRNYRDGEAKRALLALFEYLGDDPSVKDYRRQLASVLF
ncbi:MAG: tetratricopeptide repeat protein, partial [Anaerolineae bacterium]